MGSTPGNSFNSPGPSQVRRQAVSHLVSALEHFARFAPQQFTGGSEADGMSLALQQALADFAFERLDLPAQPG